MRLFLLLIMAYIALSGCSVYKAASQPGPANLEGLGVGSPRAEVISRLGPPRLADTDAAGNKQDLFEFPSGFHQASKARIIPYLAADVFTAGLAELVLWPMEMTVLDASTCTAVATYDKDRRVESWVVTKKDGTQDC